MNSRPSPYVPPSSLYVLGTSLCQRCQAIPGVLEYEGARIQLLDLPGIVEGASQGRGRGRQVVATAKTADLILIMLDATKSEEQRRLLEIELDAVGIRLNKQKPDVVFKRKTTGGVRSFHCRNFISSLRPRFFLV